MGVFSEAELADLAKGKLGRLATFDAPGMPHVVPLGWRYDPDTIDIGGRDFARTRKFHNAQRNPNVAEAALAVDDLADDPRGFIGCQPCDKSGGIVRSSPASPTKAAPDLLMCLRSGAAGIDGTGIDGVEGDGLVGQCAGDGGQGTPWPQRRQPVDAWGRGLASRS